ncbi:hypothetical protein SAMN06265377_3017 [Flagellimonas pacifica]|uniref:Uncharacterized protein n=1 Tax=Flagellimonas pacifica TaxID=1247520 RepID=A0A285N097_9FLAO|nr:hypothetical protein SAMN06265377_3017 [Allomuricauda parva]
MIREGFNHIFIVDDTIALKLKANKGDPFVFSDNYLFYTEELILMESNYLEANYIRYRFR